MTLNADQIEKLAHARFRPHRIEAIAMSHLPVFHTEHCVFCRFLSDGTDHTNCGHPCEKHTLAVRDHRGQSHPVMADVGCRNTVFGAAAQFDPSAITRWQSAGIRDFRIEFVHQTADQVAAATASMQRFLAGEISPAIAESEIQDQFATTIGSLFVDPEYESLVQLS